jgi:hypothetical protein
MDEEQRRRRASSLDGGEIAEPSQSLPAGHRNHPSNNAVIHHLLVRTEVAYVASKLANHPAWCLCLRQWDLGVRVFLHLLPEEVVILHGCIGEVKMDTESPASF